MGNDLMSEEFIYGWKNIARLLGVFIRTAQRLEKRAGLPVRRLPFWRPVALAYEVQVWVMEYITGSNGKGSGKMKNNPLDEAHVTGWKRIARHMGVSVRTAQRMEKEYGMPILRFPGGRPVMIRGEIPLWLMEYDRLKRERKQKEKARDSGAG